MTTMQESEGPIDDLSGEMCDELIGVGEPSKQNTVMFAMLRSGSRWFRLTIDEGVLFFEPSEDPVSSGEIDDEDEVLNLLPAGTPVEIEAIQFRDRVLEIELAAGGRIRFHEDTETSMMRIDYSR